MKSTSLSASFLHLSRALIQAVEGVCPSGAETSAFIMQCLLISAGHLVLNAALLRPLQSGETEKSTHDG